MYESQELHGFEIECKYLEIKDEAFNFCATRDTRNAKWMTILNWFAKPLPVVNQTEINSP